MGSDLPDLGKGLFGYRKSAVNQIIADRDTMLRQAEGRVRASEAKVAQLEVELSSFRERSSRMDEQIEQLRSQLDVVLQRAEAGTLGHVAQPTPFDQEVPGPGPAEEPEAAPPRYQEAQMSESNAEAPARQAEPEWMPTLPVAPAQQAPAHSVPPPPSAPAPAPPRADDPTSRFLTEELAGILAAAEESATRIVERARSSTQRQIMESNRLWREVQAEIARFASWRDQVEPVIRQVQSKVESVRDLVEDVPERIRHALAPMADAISSIDADMSELGSALTPPLLLTPSGLEGEGQSWLSEAPQSSPDLGVSPQESADEAPRTYEGGEPPDPFGAEAS